MLSNISKRILIICIFLLVCAVSVFLTALLVCGNIFDKVMLIAASVLILAIPVILIYYDSLSEENIQIPNFFLYEEDLGANIDLSELKFETVNERCLYYIEQNFASQKVLWFGNGLSAGSKFGSGGVYRPIIVYKMLYDVASYDIPKLWRIFWHCPQSTLNAIYICLEQNHDTPIVNRLRGYIQAGEDHAEELRKYFLSNREYIKDQMLGYVCKNIDMFY